LCISERHAVALESILVVSYFRLCTYVLEKLGALMISSYLAILVLAAPSPLPHHDLFCWIHLVVHISS
jgi:hypothetical protein